MENQELLQLIEMIDNSSITSVSYESDGVNTYVTLEKEINKQKKCKNKTDNYIEETNNYNNKTQEVETDNTHLNKTVNASEKIHEIKSPMVGTVFLSPEPTENAYVEQGSQITLDTTVCVIEAMKLFNEIDAEIEGEIVDILVQDGEVVEYDQPLFKVKIK